MMYEFNGLLFGREDLIDNEEYVVLPDFPVPVFVGEANTVVIIRNYLAISKSYYQLPPLEDQMEFERFCASPLGQKTLVADMLSLATAVSSMPEAKEHAGSFIR